MCFSKKCHFLIELFSGQQKAASGMPQLRNYQYFAFLARTSFDLLEKFNTNDCFVNVQNTMVATSKNDFLTSGARLRMIRTDTGQSLDRLGADVWTGLDKTKVRNCDNWSSGTVSGGYSNIYTDSLLEGSTAPCSTRFRLLCVSIDVCTIIL